MISLGSDLDRRLARLTPRQRELLLRKLDRDRPEPGPRAPALPRLHPDPERRHQPFPLAEIQRVYQAGRSGLFDLGRCGTNVYFELEIGGLAGSPVGRIAAALRRLVERHDVLRLVLLPDGEQRVLDRAPPFQLTLHDLRRLTPEARERALEAVREELRYRKGDVVRFPLFDAVVSWAGEGPLLLHMRIETFLIDGSSRIKLLLELAEVLGDSGELPEPPELSYRDYLLGWEELRRHPLYLRSREHWLERLDELPLGPELPLVHAPRPDTRSRFVFRYGGLPPAPWRALKERARRAGLTPSGALLAAFAAVVGHWSRSPRFSIQLATTLRVPFHPDVERLVGNFNGAVILPVTPVEGSFERRARSLQDEITRGVEHQYFSGFELLREMNRRRRSGTRATLPVVVSSVIEYNQPSYRRSLATARPAEGGPAVEARSIGIFVPQVILLVTLFEGPDEALAFSWQTVEELFLEGVVEAMFGAFIRLVEDLAATEDAWREGAAGTRRRALGHSTVPSGGTPVPWAPSVAREERPAPTKPGAAPSELAAAVAETFARCLGLAAVEPTHDFYDAGGDSLAFVRLLEAIRERFGAEIDPETFLDSPTVGRLAHLVWAAGTTPEAGH